MVRRVRKACRARDRTYTILLRWREAEGGMCGEGGGGGGDACAEGGEGVGGYVRQARQACRGRRRIYTILLVGWHPTRLNKEVCPGR